MNIILIAVGIILLGIIISVGLRNLQLKRKLSFLSTTVSDQQSEMIQNAEKKKLLIKTADDFISKNQNLISLLEEKNEEVRSEQLKNEKLLLNILPKEIVEELKQKESVEAKLFTSSTVLFTDFKGFTALSEVLSPAELIDELNCCFSEFDKIVGQCEVEKIKTIGDAYMAVAGVPSEDVNHAKKALNAALGIQSFILQRGIEKKALNEPFFEIRVGLHSGPVIAGVVGLTKFQYDIWGDTVNTASRMESSGEVGKVNISESTYLLLENDTDFSFEKRGKIEAKGKGMLNMYFATANADTK